MSSKNNPARFRAFIAQLAANVDLSNDEAWLLEKNTALLQELVSHDDWLPDDYTLPHPQYYQQYLLYADARQRFSVVSFVWGPGQKTPVHDHTVWGLIGVLRGAETSTSFYPTSDGKLLPSSETHTLRAGDVEAVSPRIGDIHQVSNAYTDRTSISIHVYGANIGAVQRSVYLADGQRKPFISGYSNQHLPNFFDQSKE